MAFDNVHYEPNLISQYQKEYLTLINYYTQTLRPSIFVKYYNINLTSIYDDVLFSTYDNYSVSNIFFDIYEYTPAYFTQSISNKSTYDELSAGDVLKGISSIVVNTIKRPKINDLILFYSPIKSQEIFQVTEVTTTVNMIHSDVPTNWFELDLEYAPIESVTNLLIKDHFIFDLTLEKYLELNVFRSKINEINNVNEILLNISQYYNYNLDVYLTEHRYIPIACNDILFIIKDKYKKKFNDVKLNKPYNLIKYHDRYEINPYLTSTNLFDVYDLENSELTTYEFDLSNPPQNELEQLIIYGKQLASYIN